MHFPPCPHYLTEGVMGGGSEGPTELVPKIQDGKTGRKMKTQRKAAQRLLSVGAVFGSSRVFPSGVGVLFSAKTALKAELKTAGKRLRKPHRETP